jgi:glycosyltransferase involved in cell wall biosynthesis
VNVVLTSRPRRLRVSVAPTLNEAKNLPLVWPRIPSWGGEVFVVDGCLTDGTVAVA